MDLPESIAKWQASVKNRAARPGRHGFSASQLHADEVPHGVGHGGRCQADHHHPQAGGKDRLAGEERNGRSQAEEPQGAHRQAGQHRLRAFQEEERADRERGAHGNTFGGNPIAA